MAEQKKQEEPKPPRRRVKKVKGHGGHHGGAWKVAYADFVTAMMALFLVLWLVSQADVKLKQSIASYFRSPGVFDSTKGGVLSGPEKVSKSPEKLTTQDDEQALTGVAEALRKKFDSRPEFTKAKDRVKIQVTEEGLRVELLDKADKISFPSGSAEMSEDAKAILTEIAQAVCELPNRILIGGHTDSKPFGENSDYTNWELSADRANAARRALEAECVKPEQIARIVGYADTIPLMPDDPLSSANRRISITVLRLAQEPPIGEVTPKKKEDSESEEPAETTVKPSKKEVSEDKKTTEKLKPNTEKPKVEAEKAKPAEPEKTPAKATEPETDEKRKAQIKLATEGAVRIGEPDKIPAKAKKLEVKPNDP